MNHEIPKPLRNALARQAVGDVHPSPDVLTSFMERTLTPVESEVVAHHLAQCTECREIVFLASDAAEEEARHEEELVAAASIRQAAAMPVYADFSGLPDVSTDRPRPRRATQMRWAVSLAAVVVVASAGLVLQLSRVRRGPNAAPITVANNQPAPANSAVKETATAPNSQETLAKPAAPEPLAKAAPQATTHARSGKVPALPTVAHNAAAGSSPALTANSTPQPAAAPSTPTVIGGAAPFAIPAAPTQNSFAEGEAAQAVQQAAPLTFGKTRMGMLPVHTVRPQWRIGPEGHLERSTVPDQWTRVLDDQPVTFRVVSVVANDVWAGGNNGALFHSPDRGAHWSKVALAANSMVEAGAIVAIRFDDPQHGIVTSDSGARWATADGGITWATQ